MFDEKINVAAIMREIKAGVIIEKQEDSMQQEFYTDDIKRITDFIMNTNSNSERCLNIGSSLPACSRFPALIGSAFRFTARIVRKAARFIIRDQITVNHNMTACIKALLERDDAVRAALESERKELDDAVRAALESERKELIEKINELENRNRELGCGFRDLKDRVSKIEDKAQVSAEQIIRLEHKNKALEFKITASDNPDYQNEVFNEEQYLRFENRFRGNPDDVRRRMEYYINHFVEDAGEAGCMAVDIGCGRGEWMQLMNAKGYKTIGIDLNAEMVCVCAGHGLNAICDDGIAYLGSVRDNSISVISAFQVIEHISKTRVMHLIQEACRVLKPGGLLLLETPNIQNVEVGAGTFYLDPTHINPMHPDLLMFMAETAGFAQHEIVHWNKDMVEQWIAQLVSQDKTDAMDSDIVRTVLETIKDKIYISPDYALAARK